MVALEKRKTCLWMLAFSILLMHVVHAQPLALLQCPKKVYRNEIFQCKATLYALFGSTDVRASFGSDGKIIVEQIPDSNFFLNTGQLWQSDVNMWAIRTGKALVYFEYNTGSETYAQVASVWVTEPPLSLKIPKIDVLPGKSARAKVVIDGRADDVELLLKYPPSLSGEEKVHVGTVSGERVVTFTVGADPFAVGTYPLTVYVRFSDGHGIHVLKYAGSVDVGIPFIAWIALFVIIFVVVAAYGYAKKKRGAQRNQEK